MKHFQNSSGSKLSLQVTLDIKVDPNWSWASHGLRADKQQLPAQIIQWSPACFLQPAEGDPSTCWTWPWDLKRKAVRKGSIPPSSESLHMAVARSCWSFPRCVEHDQHAAVPHGFRSGASAQLGKERTSQTKTFEHQKLNYGKEGFTTTCMILGIPGQIAMI